MQHLEPEQFINASDSRYQRAVKHGFRGLRFVAELEQEFQSFYTEAHLLRMRLAGYLGIGLYGLFALIDIATLPSYVWSWTVAIRLGLIVPTYVVALIVTFRSASRRYVPLTVLIASLVTGLGTVAVIGVALRQHFQIPYEGILLVALFIYLIVCLQWWRALVTNLLILAALIAMEFTYQTDPQARLYQIIFMCAANAVGAYGGYFLEYSTRTTFLVNALLSELAERDSLTGLYNRRALKFHLDRAWRQALREEHELAIVMIDIDHFKRYNDRYGHVQGDLALKAVADVIASQARRPLDIAARYGGEEFVIIWYHALVSELEAMGKRLTTGVAGLNIPHADSELGYLTISVGIARTQPETGKSSEDLLRNADRALYEAKHQGRNRVIVLG